MSVADGYVSVLQAAARGARPDPALKIDEWAEEFMELPRDAAKAGKYRIANTPLARRIMQCLSPAHPARRIVVRGASQMIKTQIAINCIGAWAHRAPANILVIEPNDTLTKRVSARVKKAIKAVPELEEVFAPPRSRDTRNTVYAKDFLGGTVYFTTAGSDANLAEIPAPYIIIDEVDRVNKALGSEGDKVEMIEARATTFESRAKFYEVSSPTRVGESKIDELYEMGTQEVYLVPCPHCRHHQELTLEGFRYARDPDSGIIHRAWFQCLGCGADIEESHKRWMMRDAPLGGTAHWHARSLGDGETVSFDAAAFYAMQGSVTWLRLARQYDRAKQRHERGDDEAIEVFYNLRLAKSWTNTKERTTAQELQERAQAENLPPLIIPDPALIVIISVDTQLNRLEVQAEAWGPRQEHWVIDHQVLMGSPAVSPDTPGSVWASLDEYRRQPFLHASGAKIYAKCCLIDSGGSNTQDVYNYARARINARVLAIRGLSQPGKPIISTIPAKVDVDWRGEKVAGGAEVWTIGTDTAKDSLINRLKVTSGEGAMHFNSALSLEWFEGLLSERRMLKKKPGGGFRSVWDKISAGARNEPLDLSVYNLAGAYYLGLHKLSALDWEQLRARVIPATPAGPLVRRAPVPPGRRVINAGI